MTVQERVKEIKENLLWLGNKPGVAVAAAYDDPYYGDKHVNFTALTKEEILNQIIKYAEEHPVP